MGRTIFEKNSSQKKALSFKAPEKKKGDAGISEFARFDTVMLVFFLHYLTTACAYLNLRVFLYTHTPCLCLSAILLRLLHLSQSDMRPVRNCAATSLACIFFFVMYFFCSSALLLRLLTLLVLHLWQSYMRAVRDTYATSLASGISEPLPPRTRNLDDSSRKALWPEEPKKSKSR